MRHDVIHEMQCGCDRCTPRHAAPAVDPLDLDAIRKGVVLALWVGGVLAARQYGPSIIDWIAS